MNGSSIPASFMKRRLQSVAGIFLVLFLIEHLLTNSQAALWLGEDGRGFIDAVTAIHQLPYLQVLEVLLIGLPFLIHGVYGIGILRTSEPNARATDGSKPSLGWKGRNGGYTWQRITAWILLVGVVLHVIDMRFIDYPKEVRGGINPSYVVELTEDTGIFSLAERLNVKLEKKGNGIVAITPNFATASLLVVRDTFKNPWMVLIYSLFVVTSCYHAFYGLWTASITWGLIQSRNGQRIFLFICVGLMLLVMGLGLAASLGTFYNLES